MDYHILTPLHILKTALRNNKCHELIRNIEPQTTFKLERLWTVVPTHTTKIASVGSAGSRTEEQAQIAKRLCLELLNSFTKSQPIIFTDGSALVNPGPCGSAAVVFAKGMMSTPVVIKQAVSQYSTNYHGEIFAIQLAIEYAVLYKNCRKYKTVYIMSDCQSAINSVCSREAHDNHQDIIDKCHKLCADLKHHNINVEIHWVPGHVDLEGNEVADRSANVGSRGGRQYRQSMVPEEC